MTKQGHEACIILEHKLFIVLLGAAWICVCVHTHAHVPSAHVHTLYKGLSIVYEQSA